MADVKVSIKDEQSAKQWLAQVQEINQDYYNAMADASETLINMKDFADGTLVDDFVEFGNELLTAAKSTFDAIDTIADTVNKVLSFAQNFVENAVSGIGKLASTVLGR